MSGSPSTTLSRITIEATPAPRSIMNGVRGVLGGLVSPRPELASGFTATDRIGAECYGFHVCPDAPLGPIHYSCDTNSIFVYTARYKDDSIGVIIISGEYVKFLIRSGKLQEEYDQLLAHTETHGEVSAHTLTQVMTPVSASSCYLDNIAFINMTEVKTFFAPHPLNPGPLKLPLQVLRIKLSGFPVQPAAVCTIESSIGNHEVFLSIGRNVTDPHPYAVNVTALRREPSQSMGW
jgi:hypothetical protein